MSIVNWYKNMHPSDRFLITLPFWLIVLFGLFYWGKFWSYSPIGEALDSFQRGTIMPILDAFIDKPIKEFNIFINPKYSIVITPECNGLVPYLIILASILAYSCKLIRKIIWAIVAYIVIYIVNLIRLIVVVKVVEIFGEDYFYLIHDIGGNALLIITGGLLFLLYLKGCRD